MVPSLHHVTAVTSRHSWSRSNCGSPVLAPLPAPPLRVHELGAVGGQRGVDGRRQPGQVPARAEHLAQVLPPAQVIPAERVLM